MKNKILIGLGILLILSLFLISGCKNHLTSGWCCKKMECGEIQLYNVNFEKMVMVKNNSCEYDCSPCMIKKIDEK